MPDNKQYVISILLVLSFGFMITLASGGQIYTGNVFQSDNLILNIFYSFLTLLTLISIVLVLFIIESKRWAYVVSALCGISYFFIYTIDLGTLFPPSPHLFPRAIVAIEILGIITSIVLIMFSIQGALKCGKFNTKHMAESK